MHDAPQSISPPSPQGRSCVGAMGCGRLIRLSQLCGRTPTFRGVKRRLATSRTLPIATADDIGVKQRKNGQHDGNAYNHNRQNHAKATRPAVPAIIHNATAAARAGHANHRRVSCRRSIDLLERGGVRRLYKTRYLTGRVHHRIRRRIQ